MTDRPTAEPLKHIARSEPPWRTVERTECGRVLSDTGSVVTRDEAIAEWKRLGQQRAAFVFCMTCANTANRHTTWEHDPLSVIARYATSYWRHDDDAERKRRELRVVAALVEAHRDEFDAAMAGYEQIGDLAQRRAAKRRGAR